MVQSGGVSTFDGSTAASDGDRPQHGGVSGSRQESGGPGGGSSSLERGGPGGAASLESGGAGGGDAGGGGGRSLNSGRAGTDSDAAGHRGGMGDGGGAGLLALRQAALALGARILGGAGAVHVWAACPAGSRRARSPRRDHAQTCAAPPRTPSAAPPICQPRSPSTFRAACPSDHATAAVEAIVEGACGGPRAHPAPPFRLKADALETARPLRAPRLSAGKSRLC
jgi:hypothetical protein